MKQCGALKHTFNRYMVYSTHHASHSSASTASTQQSALKATTIWVFNWLSQD